MMARISFAPEFDPVDSLLSLQQELERFLRNPLGNNFGLSGGGLFPPINIFSNGDGVVVRAEVPGINGEAVTLAIEGRTLTIRGERTPATRPSGGYHRRERRFGKFSRSLQLPEDLDFDQTAAECRNGVLTVRIPKRAEAKPRVVKVQSA